jgi:hypothetical protein
VTDVYLNGEDARIVREGDINLHWLGAKYPVNSPSGIVTKPPKPGFVGFGSTHPGDIQGFLAGFIQGVISIRSALTVAAGLKGGGGPTRSLNGFSQTGGDV